MKGSTIDSLLQSTCETINNPNLYSCMANDYDSYSLNKTYLISYFNKTLGQNAQNIHDMKDKIMEQWSIYILTPGDVVIQGTKIQGPRIGMCGNNIELYDSKADSSWRGCPHDTGSGSLKKNGECAGPGAAHGGFGGYGGVESNDLKDQEDC